MPISIDQILAIVFGVAALLLWAARRPRRRPEDVHMRMRPRADRDPRQHFTVTPPVYDWTMERDR